MTSLRIPRYLKIFDIQSMLKYILMREKRPAFIQLKTVPSVVLIAKVDDRNNTSSLFEVGKNCIQKTAEEGDGQLLEEDSLNTALKEIGLDVNVHICENLALDCVYNGLLKYIDVDKVDLEWITPETLELVERHDILHLFSYSTYIKSQTDFNEENFNTFIKPKKKTEHFLVAIDCEMVLGLSGPRLGRVTILDCKGSVIYDKYVSPGERVLDYREKYSGLNEQNLSLGLPFKQIQDDILNIIGTNTCVLGHGLENDLEVLQLYADNIIDTAYLFLSSDGYKIKLNQLSKKYLNEIIQQGTHCSHEDAFCCLKLLAYKIRQLQLLYADNTACIDLDAEVVKLASLEDVKSRYNSWSKETGDTTLPRLLFTCISACELRDKFLNSYRQN